MSAFQRAVWLVWGFPNRWCIKAFRHSNWKRNLRSQRNTPTPMPQVCLKEILWELYTKWKKIVSAVQLQSFSNINQIFRNAKVPKGRKYPFKRETVSAPWQKQLKTIKFLLSSNIMVFPPPPPRPDWCYIKNKSFLLNKTVFMAGGGFCLFGFFLSENLNEW